MKPFHVENGVTIYCGDALAVLDELQLTDVQAFVTDPPYCSGAFTEAGRKSVKGQGLRRENVRRDGWFDGDNMGTAALTWLMRQVAVQAARALVRGGSLCAFTDWRMAFGLGPAMESSGLRMQNVVVWDKGSAGLGHGFRAQHEMVLHLVKGTGRFNSASYGNVLKCGRIGADRLHPTEKPGTLVGQLLEVVSFPGDLVVDPFCGSGTVGERAAAMGRRAILIDNDPGHCETAAKRLAQRGLFDDRERGEARG